MRPNWQGFNQNLSTGINALMARELEKRKKQEDFNNAIMQMIIQSRIKQQFDPEAQFRQQMLNMFTQGQGGNQQQPQMGGGFKPKSFSYGGFTMEKQPTEEEIQADIEQAVKKTAAIEGAKPYSEGEIKIVSGLSLIPKIDELIKLAQTKNVYGEGKFGGSFIPFGASRISAFGEEGPWQSFKRGLTAGVGRQAGLILQDIKQLMFATGGQALTDPEIKKLAPKLEPAYKTEQQWIADLQDVRQRIIEKARLMRPNPNVALPGGMQQIDDNKQSKQLDKNTAIRFLNQANGNKELARELARKAGYQF